MELQISMLLLISLVIPAMEKKETANYSNLLLGNISLLDQSRKWGDCPIFANSEMAAVLESLEGLFLGLT